MEQERNQVVICKCTKEKEIATLQSETKTLFNRVDENREKITEVNKLYRMIYELTSTISVVAEQMKTTKEDIEVIKSDVNRIKNQPSDEMRHYKRTITTAIITSILAFVIGRIL